MSELQQQHNLEAERISTVASAAVVNTAVIVVAVLQNQSNEQKQDAIITTHKHDYVVVQYMFGETSMKLQPLHEQTLESSILDMHGRVVWRGRDMASPCCEELIGRPCLLDDKTAGCMANAIEKHFPMDIYVPSEAAEWVGLCPGGDAAKANTKLFNVVQEESRPHVFVVPGTSTQHRTSNFGCTAR